MAQLQGSNDPGTDEELETGPEQKGCFSYQNSPGSHLSNQDAENESLLSDASDQVSDIKSVCGRDASDKKASMHPKLPNEAHNCMDKMTAVYANILSDSYWSGLGLGFKLSNSERRNCDTRNGSNKTDFDWHQDALSKSLQQNLPSRSIRRLGVCFRAHELGGALPGPLGVSSQTKDRGGLSVGSSSVDGLAGWWESVRFLGTWSPQGAQEGAPQSGGPTRWLSPRTLELSLPLFPLQERKWLGN